MQIPISKFQYPGSGLPDFRTFRLPDLKLAFCNAFFEVKPCFSTASKKNLHTKIYYICSARTFDGKDGFDGLSF
jgi:hypothetical protein